jgi:hypothetical protein
MAMPCRKVVRIRKFDHRPVLVAVVFVLPPGLSLLRKRLFLALHISRSLTARVSPAFDDLV